MMNKPNKIMFMTMLMLSVMLSVSSNSWFMVWMGMEMNIMSFIPMILNINMTSKESAMTYFMIQAIASMLLIMSMILMKTKLMNNEIKSIMLMSALMMKSGIAPFHFWLPKTMEGMSWNMCLILMTVQKMIPLMIMSNLMKMNVFTMLSMTMSIIVGAMGGLTQTSLRKLMAYSSIMNNGWMMMAMMSSEIMWIIYFIMYTMMTTIMIKMMNNYKIYHLNQLMSMNETLNKKMIMMLNILSMSGLPPFLGFLPKWLTIQPMINMSNLLTLSLVVMMTLIALYYYLRIMYSVLMLSTSELNWNKKKMKNKWIMMMLPLSMMGLMLITLMY
nr:NADH dehydrogenase subunit 2 [Carausius sp.]